MKVGILTFHDANNYGAVLQAYALQEAIKSFGCEVEIIDYKQKSIIDNYKVVRIKKNRLIRSVMSTIINYSEFSNRAKVFSDFRNKRLNLSKEKFKKIAEIKGYEIYISGSDQVWNTRANYFDEVYFLNFCGDNIIKSSYAASIGYTDFSNKEKKFMFEKLMKFDFISVREESAKKKLANIVDKDIEKVVDPTMLNKCVWDDFIDTNCSEKYIFVYSVGEINNLLEVASKVKKILRIKVYIITEKRFKNKYDFKLLRGIKPESLISIVYNAKFVITNSYHGTIFSVLFNKKFFVIPHKSSGNRMIELLRQLNLESRIIKYIDKINENVGSIINYKLVNEILESERVKSMKYLKKVIKSNKKYK